MSTPQNFHIVSSPAHFQDILSQDLNRVSLINFWAPWAAPCAQMNEVVLELARKYSDLLVLQVEAEEQPDIAESFEVEAVPTFIILRGHTLLNRVSGADASTLASSIVTHLRPVSAVTPKSFSNSQPASSDTETPAQLEQRIKGLMSQHRVMLFMKGNPDAPRCGFSRKTVGILRDHGVQFGSFDILSDESVRQGMKVVNNWPTFPQLIVSGEFVGGLDIIQEMIENGEFDEIVVGKAE